MRSGPDIQEVWAWISCIYYLSFPSHLSHQLAKERTRRSKRADLGVGLIGKKRLPRDQAKWLIVPRSNTNTPHNLTCIPEESLYSRGRACEGENRCVKKLQTPGSSRTTMVTKAIFIIELWGAVPDSKDPYGDLRGDFLKTKSS